METINNISLEKYQDFLDNHPEANFLQSPLWGELHERLGNKVVRSGLVKNDEVQAVWTGIIKDAKRGRYLEVPGGPIANYGNSELINKIFESLRQTAKQQNCVFVRFRPQQPETTELEKLFEQNKARLAPFHLHAEHTIIVDATKSTDELLADMRRQTRYEIRQVAKRNVNISSCVPDDKSIDEFYNLQLQTAHRHNFIQSSRKFMHVMSETFGEHVKLYRAEKDGKLLNMALVIMWGKEAVYFEAASTPEARKQPGAYGIIWRAMQDAKSGGCERFNLWGIAYTNNPHHRYAGVTTFKRGFGGSEVTFASAHDLIIKPARYQINWLIEVARKKKRGL